MMGDLWYFNRYDRKGKPHIKIVGLDYEAPTPLYRETESYIVIKVPGRKCWVDRMVGRQYTHPEFVIFKKEGDQLRMMKDIEYQKGGLAKAKMEVVEFLAYGKS